MQPETLANTFYALVGALTRSVDVSQSSLFVRDFLIATLSDKDITTIWTPFEPVKTLDDILSRDKRGPADFRLAAQAGASTILAVYQVAVYSDKVFLGMGE